METLVKYATRIGLSVASLVISLLLVEVAIRVFFPKYDPSGQLSIPKTAAGFWLGPPNVINRQWDRRGDFDVQVRFNPYGFRDQNDLRRATDADWFVVGDSTTFGWGVTEDHRYSGALAARLAAPVYNIGVLGNFNEYSQLVKYAESLGAPVRRLVVGVCMENDLLDYEKVIPLHKTTPTPLAGVKTYFEERSAVYQSLATTLHETPSIRNLAYRLKLIRGAHEGLHVNTYSDTGLKSSAMKLATMLDGREAIVLIIPSRGLWLGANKEQERKVHEAFVAALQANGLRVADPRAAFEEGGNPMQYHFSENGHWNPRGHALAADVLVEAIHR